MSDLLEKISEKLDQGQRLTFEDGRLLFQSQDILGLGKLAQKMRRKLHGNRVFYSLNFHLNHTNVCTTRCDFCAFSRKEGEKGAYTFTVDEIEQKISEVAATCRINEIHMVGGHNPVLGLGYFVELFSRIRSKYSRIFIKALSAPEIHDLAVREMLSVKDVLKVLKEAGLDSLPGGGAEIFDPEVRKQICPGKISGEMWLEIHRTAHTLGIPTNATMLYGYLENDSHRVDHILKLRELQDETGGFQCFVPLAFQPKLKPDFENVPESSVCLSPTSGFLDLKVLSISRLLLDNIPHIKVHWPATDLKFAQATLAFGVDDIGGINLNEQVMREAGGKIQTGLSSSGFVRYIENAGYEPCLADSSYTVL